MNVSKYYLFFKIETGKEQFGHFVNERIIFRQTMWKMNGIALFSCKLFVERISFE